MLGVPLPHLCWAESVVTTTPGPSTAISELGIRILGSARLPRPSVFKEQPPHLGSLVKLTDDTSPNSISKTLSILLLRHFQALPSPSPSPNPSSSPSLTPLAPGAVPHFPPFSVPNAVVMGSSLCPMVILPFSSREALSSLELWFLGMVICKDSTL